ncbi:MAG: translocation/assembly module TamB domain-containing protein [Candidatus Latescibacterota bacterium]
MKRHSSSLRTLVRQLAVGLLGVFVAVFILLFLLTLGPGENLLRRISESKLRGVFQQDVRIGDVETNLLSRLQLSNVRIGKQEDGSRAPLLTLAHAKVTYRLFDLFLRRISVEALEVDSLYVHLERDSVGQLNLPFRSSSPPPPSTDAERRGFGLRVGRVSVRHSYFRVQDELIPLDASIDNLHAGATYEGMDTYAAHLEADSIRVVYLDMPIAAKALRLTGRWNPQGGQLDAVSMTLPGFDLTGQGEVVQYSVGSSLAGTFELRGNPSTLTHLARARIPAECYPIDGDMRVSIQVAGSLDQPVIAAQILAPDMKVAGFSITDGQIRASWRREAVHLEKLHAQLFGGTITGQGEVSTDTLLTHRLDVKVEGMEIAQICRAFAPTVHPPSGNVGLTLRSSGWAASLDAIEATGDLVATQMYYNARSVPDIKVRFHLNHGQGLFRVNQGNSEASAQVAWDGRVLKGGFSADIVELASLAELFDIPELSGAFACSGTFAGTPENPDVRAEFTGRHIQYQHFPVDTLAGHGVYRNKQPRLSDLYAAGHLDSIDPLRPPFHLSDVTGGFTYRVRARGTVEDPQAELVVDLLNPGYAKVRLDRGEVRAQLRDRQIRLTSLELMRDSLRVHATGACAIQFSSGSAEVTLYSVPSEKDVSMPGYVPVEDQRDSVLLKRPEIGRIAAVFDIRDPSQIAVKVQGERLDLERIAKWVPEAPDIGGTLRFDLNGSGPLSAPHADLRWVAEQPRYGLAEMDSVQAEVRLTSHQVALTHLGVYVGGQYAEAQGTVGLRPGEEGGYEVSSQSALSAQVHGRAFDLQALAALWPPGVKVAGHVSCDISAYGTLGDPRVTGTVALTDGEVQLGPEVPTIQKLGASVSLQDSLVVIEEVSGSVQDLAWRLHGEVTSRQWQAFDLNMNLALADLGAMAMMGTVSQDSMRVHVRMDRMDLSLMQPFVPDVKGLTGMCDAEVVVRGPFDDPELDGSLQVRGLTLQPPGLNEKLDKGVVKVAFGNREVQIDSVFFAMGKGRILASGKVMHDRGAVSDMDLTARMEDIRVTRPKEAAVHLTSAHFRYARQNDYYVLDGDLVLGDSRVLYDFSPQALLAAARTVEKPQPEIPSLLQEIRLNLRIRESENIWIDNNLARVRLHTELAVTGSPYKPNLSGRVAIEEGYVLYLDRRFKIIRGVVDFVDANRLNPIVDFSATTTVKAYRAMGAAPYTITLAINGPLDETVVALTSVPPLEEPDIVALLTLGATRSQLAGRDVGGSSTGGVLLERAAQLSSQRISGYATRSVGKWLGLEQMSIEGNLFRRNWSSGPQLLASRKLSDRMEVAYTTSVGHFNDYSIRLDYRLSRRLSLQGQTDQGGRQAIDLNYGVKLK